MSHPAKFADQKCQTHLDHASVVQMGILNVTPDSFSDGGLFSSTHSALQHALELASAGARIIDVGGVSTRPGAKPVTSSEEWNRVSPILRELRQKLPEDVLISLDTSSPEVALKAAQQDLIDIINDVAAARVQIEIPTVDIQDLPFSTRWTTAHVAARFHLGMVLMHMQGDPETMQQRPMYDDCLSDVVDFLLERVNFVRQLGVRWCAIDPGIGFGKTLSHNLQLLSSTAISRMKAIGVPVLIGLSRKSFLKALAERDGVYPSLHSEQAERDWRDEQSQTWEKACVTWGAKIIRTHKIKSF